MLREFDPWATSDIKDYDKLVDEFGISRLSDDLAKKLNDNKYVRRGLIIGHRELDLYLNHAESGKKISVISGIKPTGIFHLGSMITAEQMVYFQKKFFNSALYYSIADLEAYMDNGQDLVTSKKLAIENVADMLVMGMDPKRSVVYMQSSALLVSDLAFIFSDDVTVNMLQDIYGERRFSLYLSALVQSGDIFLPQTKNFGGPNPVLVPVGADQDPHIRLSRDLAFKHRNDFAFLPPSSIYHKLIRSLSGDEKMSKRNPDSMITLADSKADLKRKIMAAFTGGRITIEEQRRLGGEPDKCPVFDLYLYFDDDDKEISKVRSECLAGQRLCGECKQQVLEMVNLNIEEHQSKKIKMLDLADDMIQKGNELVKNNNL
ncbi:MAG: tryptophan--tRNA ligase [Conexivisphaerales archaeon]